MIVNPYVTYNKKNNTREAVISASPRYHQDHVYPSTWTEIVPILSASDDPLFYFSCTSHFDRFYFAPKSLSGAALCRIRDPYSSASFALYLSEFNHIVNPVASDISRPDECSVRYHFGTSAHLDFIIDNDMIYKQLVIFERPDSNLIRFSISRGGASLYIDNTNIIGSKDLRQIFTTSTPSCWDSSPLDPITAVHPNKITPSVSTYYVYNNNSLVNIDIKIDDAWLDSAIYPIYIDPSLIITTNEANTSHCRILQANPTGNFHDDFLSVVQLYGQLTKSLLYFDGLSGVIDGMMINEALLSLRASYLGGLNLPLISIDRCTRNWIETQASYNKASSSVAWSTPCCNHISNDRAGTLSPATVCTPTAGTVTQFNVTDITQAWADNMTANKGYVIIEPSNLSYVHFASPRYSYSSGYSPILSVSYDSPPKGYVKKISYSVAGCYDYIISGR